MRTLFAGIIAIAVFAAAFTVTMRKPCCSVDGAARPGVRAAVPQSAGFESTPEGDKDNDWFLTQRAYPRHDIPAGALPRMHREMRKFTAASQNSRSAAGAGEWTLMGPTNIGGRINALAIHPFDPNIIYAGTASGGIWKSTDLGYTWTQVFNESFSIGAVTLDPSDPDVVYVGTGENTPAGVATYPGNGIWRSTDAGATWANIGLQQIAYTGRVVVNPQNPNCLYVAAIGQYRLKTSERGIYKSTNRGATWSKVLYLNDTTGAIDVIMDPMDTNRVFAAMWTRYRTPKVSILTSTESGVYYSSNGGASWSPVADGLLSNVSTLGRVSFTFAPSNPNIMYALNQQNTGWGGFFRSTDAGLTWVKSYTSGYSEGQVWYNNVICVNPENPNQIWAGMTSLYQSTDGGTTFGYAPYNGPSHVDYHDIAYAPSNHNIMVVGNDGGIFVSEDGGSNWRKSFNLPVTQFYAGSIGPQNPNRFIGGTQDNGTMMTGSGIPDSYDVVYGGDGFYALFDPLDSNYVYAEYQNGGLGYSTNGGVSFVYGATNGITAGDRHNWSQPVAMDWNNPKTLYTGTHRVYRTTNNMQNWTVISGDLTYGPGGRVGSISTIDVSRVDPSVIYVGTDDGRVWVSIDHGTTWNDIRGSLPLHWVTRVTADPVAANVAYVTLSGFIEGENGSHIYRTTDYGATWSDIGSSLPDLPVNDLVVDPTYPSQLYIATDLNVCYSTDLGGTWNVLGSNFPDVSVHDLDIQVLPDGDRLLAAFTHGRSIMTYTIGTSLAREFVVSLNPKWNLVSNPFSGGTDSARLLFPQMIGNAFFYTGTGYEASTKLIHGKGFWVKYPVAPDQQAVLSGIPSGTEELDVIDGWNLIGSTSANIAAGAIVPVGTSIVSNIFSYAGGYLRAETLKAGYGYWVKVAGAGKLRLVHGAAAVSRTGRGPVSPAIPSMSITDAAGNGATVLVGTAAMRGNALYEAPPAPPQGAFDARFASGSLASFAGTGRANQPIVITSASYPVRIRWDGMEQLNGAFLRVGGKLYPLNSGGDVVMQTEPDEMPAVEFAGAELPAEFSLAQNYPNPFNPSTAINFAIPEQAHVTLILYNQLGQQVALLADEELAPGSYTREWHADQLASGIYYYTLRANKWSDTRKLLLLR